MPSNPPEAGQHPQLTLVLGGVRSGKSRVAETLLNPNAPALVIPAATPPDGHDPHWQERVNAHKQRRPSRWETFEATSAAEVVMAITASNQTVLIDSLDSWMVRLIDEAGLWKLPKQATALVTDAAQQMREAIAQLPHPVIAVSLDVSTGLVPTAASGRLFQDILGRVNHLLAAPPTRVLYVTAGRVSDLSGLPYVQP